MSEEKKGKEEKEEKGGTPEWANKLGEQMSKLTDLLSQKSETEEQTDPVVEVPVPPAPEPKPTETEEEELEDKLEEEQIPKPEPKKKNKFLDWLF